MTYIEFFDKTASENILACLTFSPVRVIYIGDNSKLMRKHIANYEKVFTQRGSSIEFIYKTVSKSNLPNAVAVLSEIVETYDDCVFDITGGEEILTLALGVVYAKYPEQNIQIHKFNLRNNVVSDCDQDGKTIQIGSPALSVEENIKIYGGDVNRANTYNWDISPDFRRDIDLMWEVCRGDVRYWNMQIGMFEVAEAIGTVSEDGLTTTAYRAALDDYLLRHKLKYKRAKGIINYLIDHGLLTCFDDQDDTTVTISYKNPQVKKCLTKAGQALEMKVYVTAKELTDGNAPVYNDVLNGVVIDWDGQHHDEQTEKRYDTENEIDVMLMHGLIPVFISCKNGIVTSDELYKLNTVAEHFGGKYAKKILVATALSLIGEAGNYLRQRAKDMSITLIEDVQNLTDEEFARKLKNLWQG